MIKTLGIISGVICIIILFLNFLLYFLQDIYFKTNNKNIKKSINSALPILSKYNKCSIFICFIFFLIHISCFFNSIKHFNLNALILFFLILCYRTNRTVTTTLLKGFPNYCNLRFSIMHTLRDFNIKDESYSYCFHCKKYNMYLLG